MLEFQWNALRLGDRVVIHDDLDPNFALHDATVSMVRSRFPGASEIGVRRDDQPTALSRPWRHAVHLTPVGADSNCWRCAAGRAAPTPSG